MEKFISWLAVFLFLLIGPYVTGRVTRPLLRWGIHWEPPAAPILVWATGGVVMFWIFVLGSLALWIVAPDMGGRR